MQEEAIEIPAGAAQMGGAISEAPGRALSLQRGVNALVVILFKPLTEALVELPDFCGRLEAQALLEVGLNGEEKPFDLTFAPTVIGPGVQELDVEIGADDSEVAAGEDFSVVAVKFQRDAPAFDALAQDIQQGFERLVRIVGRRGAKARAIVDEREEPGANRAFALGAQGRPVHHVGHPQVVGERALEGFLRAGPFAQVFFGAQSASVQAPGVQVAVNAA